jgi:hypothetical protein
MIVAFENSVYLPLSGVCAFNRFINDCWFRDEFSQYGRKPFGKFGLGWLNDRLNAKRTFMLGILLTMLGIAIIQAFWRSPIMLTIGSGLYGLCMALTPFLCQC